VNARRVLLPGGDTYEYHGGHAVAISAPRADSAQAQRPGVARALAPFAPDPLLEQERALLGGFIVGDLDAAAVSAVQHAAHRRIFDALDGEYLGSVEVAIQLCRTAGLPPELVGRVHVGTPVGYLAGCVRSWREQRGGAT
jgi:hypothetical protein